MLRFVRNRGTDRVYHFFELSDSEKRLTSLHSLEWPSIDKCMLRAKDSNP